MKTNILFFVTLITFSQIFTFTAAFEAKASSTESIVSELVALNKLAGKSVGSITAIVGEIRAAAASDNAGLKALSGKIDSNCGRGKSKINSFLKRLAGDLAGDNSAINSAQTALKKLSKSIGKMTRDANAQQKGLENLAKRVHKTAQSHEAVSVETGMKVDVIKRLRDIITDELLNAETPSIKKQAPKATIKRANLNATAPSRNGSFIQIEEIRTTLIDLKEKMSKMEDKSLFSPLVETLMELCTEKNFSSQKILNKILSVLAKLSRNLQSFIKRHDIANRKISDLYDTQRKAKVSGLRALQKLLAASKQDVILNNQIIAHSSGAKGLIGTQIAKKNGELKHWNNICTMESKFFGTLKTDFAELATNLKRIAGEVAQAS
jgi:hypothetical protein